MNNCSLSFINVTRRALLQAIVLFIVCIVSILIFSNQQLWLDNAQNLNVKLFMTMSIHCVVPCFSVMDFANFYFGCFFVATSARDT